MKVLCSSQMGTGTIMGQTMRVVAIAKALQRRGHDITYVAAGKLIPIIKSFGMEVLEASDMPDFSYGMQNVTGNNQNEVMINVQGLIEKVSEIELAAVAKVKPHLIVSGTISGAVTAKQAGIPCIITLLQPHGEKTLDMFKHRLQASDDATIDDKKGGLLSSIETADLLVLEGMPEISGGANFVSFSQAASGIKEKMRFAGPLLIEQPDQLPDRDELKEIHIGKKGAPMAYITIGGGSQLIGSEFLKTVLEALKLLPEVTGVISTGMDVSPEMIESFNTPANAIIRSFVPGTEMIKASDITVFHGGSSTLMTCIACGTPAVVVPSMAEQEDNGAVLAQHGAGLVLDKQSLTPVVLAEAMKKILNDRSYRTHAMELKALGEKYGGANAAADWAEQLMRVDGR